MNDKEEIENLKKVSLNMDALVKAASKVDPKRVKQREQSGKKPSGGKKP